MRWALVSMLSPHELDQVHARERNGKFTKISDPLVWISCKGKSFFPKSYNESKKENFWEFFNRRTFGLSQAYWAMMKKVWFKIPGDKGYSSDVEIMHSVDRLVHEKGIKITFEEDDKKGRISRFSERFKKGWTDKS